MTVLMITLWLSIQLPAGIWLGRMLQQGVRQPDLVPARARRSARRWRGSDPIRLWFPGLFDFGI